MAEFKFTCPRCGQHIAGDESWGGHQIQCPVCQAQLIVPQVGPAASAPPPPVPIPSPSSMIPPPPPPGAPKLGLGRAESHAAAPPPPPSKPAPQRRAPAAAPSGAKGGGVVKILKIAAILVVLGVGGYFGFIGLSHLQESMNTERRKVEKQSDGGEMGHIANVYEVLDATETTRHGPSSSGRHVSSPDSSRVPLAKAVKVGSDSEDYDASGAKQAPLVPAVWTLDLDSAKIPDSRANGMIAGTNFVVESASFQTSGTSQVLALRQGTIDSASRALMVYLRLKPGETFAGHSWTVTADMKGAGVPQVLKQWKNDARFAAQQKFFNSGYAMKLELGQPKDGVTPGKIFLALPDAEKTVVAGSFKIGEFPLDALER